MRNNNLGKAKPNVEINSIVRKTRLIINLFFITRNCFIRSFASFMILKKFGITVSFNIGVMKDSEVLSHSWISKNDHPILERKEISDYKIIYKI